MATFCQEEADSETLECARYGEEEDLRALLVSGASVNHVDSAGNSALHKASANGEVACMRVLKEFGALLVANRQGNLPTHWAAQNGKAEALQFLVDNYTEQIDMLAKNSFGRSSLTEAFQSQNEAVIEICLSHPSSSEERLMPQAQAQSGVPPSAAAAESSLESAVEGMDIAGEGGGGEDASAFLEMHAVQHCMSLNSSVTDLLLIRELPITRADSPFGSEAAPEDDTTGLGIWPAAVLAARWVAKDLVEALRGKVVVELGCGCGLPGLAAARYASPRSVYLTDIHAPTLQNTIHNAHLNALPAASASATSTEVDPSRWGVLDQTTVLSSCAAPVAVYTCRVSWTDPSTYPAEKAEVLLGSDLVYDSGILAALTQAVSGMLAAEGSFFYIAPADARDGMDGLKESLAACGLVCVQEGRCGDELFANPLVEQVGGGDVAGDGAAVVAAHDAFVLHFYDLAAKTAHLWYHFRRNL